MTKVLKTIAVGMAVPSESIHVVHKATDGQTLERAE